MLDPLRIEEFYKEYTEHLFELAHDGVIEINLGQLHEMGLLENFDKDTQSTDDLTQYFHVIESAEKVTLFNEQFLIWIVPKMKDDIPITYVLIAISAGQKNSLEVVFTTSGIYNTPKFVLKVLQSFLMDMLETQATLTSFEKNQ